MQALQRFSDANNTARDATGSLSWSDVVRYAWQRTCALMFLGTLVFVLGAVVVGLRRMLDPEMLRAARRSYLRLLRQDLRNARNGRYPASLLTGSPVFGTIASAPSVVTEFFRSLPRRRTRETNAVPPMARVEDDLVSVFDELGMGDAGARRRSIDALRANWEHYGLTFHWQRDGYLSRSSARLYEPTVELSLAGVVDVMRRMALAPLLEALADRKGPRVIDLSAGTGRFLLQLVRARPDARIVAHDISPYYLLVAKSLLPKETQFIAGDAASVSLEEASMDAVVVSYVLHEMPTHKRLSVLREARRLVAPNGIVIIYESTQNDAVDSFSAELLRTTKQLFQDLSHEPYFDSFTREPLVEQVESVGLRVVVHEDHYVTKVIAARP